LKTGKLPQSLRQVAEYVHSDCGWRYALRCFLDVFYMMPYENKQTMLDEVPPITEDILFNAYSAACAEYLAWEYRLHIPDWTCAPTRFLREPHFPRGLSGTKKYLLATTPSSFERRMIFTGANPLYRPRKDYHRFIEMKKTGTLQEGRDEIIRSLL